MKKIIPKAAFFSAAACLALSSCSSTSALGLAKASYVNEELEKLNERTAEMESLESRIDELSALEEKITDLDESMAEAQAADEELRNMAADFAARLEGLSRDTLLELVEAIMEHVESTPAAE